MIEVFGTKEESREYRAAIWFRNMVLTSRSEIESKQGWHIWIVVKPYTQQVKNQLDLLILGNFDEPIVYSPEFGIKDETGARKQFPSVEVHSFCVVVEVKDHEPDEFRIIGENEIEGHYNDQPWENFTHQNYEQKSSLLNYLRNDKKFPELPWINKLLWVRKFPYHELPALPHTIITDDQLTFDRFLSMLSQDSNHYWMDSAWTLGKRKKSAVQATVQLYTSIRYINSQPTDKVPSAAGSIPVSHKNQPNPTPDKKLAIHDTVPVGKKQRFGWRRKSNSGQTVYPAKGGLFRSRFFRRINLRMGCLFFVILFFGGLGCATIKSLVSDFPTSSAFAPTSIPTNISGLPATTIGSFTPTVVVNNQTAEKRVNLILPVLKFTETDHTAPVTSVRWSPDGQLLASGAEDNSVNLWDYSKGRLSSTFKGPTSAITTITWSPDGKRLVAGLKDSTIWIWDLSGQPAIVLTGHTGSITSVAWDPTGEKLASSSRDGTVPIWDSATKQSILTLNGDGLDVETVTWSPDGKYLVSGGRDSKLYIWEANTGNAISKFNVSGGWIYSVAWSPKGDHLAVAAKDGTISVWDVAKKEVVLTLAGAGDAMWETTWSPDGNYIAGASRDKTVRIWDAKSGQSLFVLSDNPDSVTSLSWSPDGSFLATSSLSQVEFWQIGTPAANLQ